MDWVHACRPTVVAYGVLVAVSWIPKSHAAEDTQTATPPHPVVPGFERFYAETDQDAEDTELVRAGRLLLSELNCTSCHPAGDGWQSIVEPKQAPILDEVGSRVRPESLRSFLADPQHAKPGTTMPALFRGTPAEKKRHQIEALVHFLASTGTTSPTIPSSQAVRHGRTLFHSIGCVACHNPQTGDGADLPHSVPLGDLTAKYTISGLTAFLRDPLQIRPSGRMPHFKLSEEDAHHLAQYLLRDVEVEPNLRFAYFEGGWQSLPDFAAMEPKTAGTVAGFDIHRGERTSNFGMRFEGFLPVEKSGEYTFHLGSDDGSRLWIDGESVVTNDGVHPFRWQSGRTRLSTGVHEVAVDFFQGGGELELRVEFEGPDVPRQSLANSVILKPDAPDRQQSFLVDAELAKDGRKLFASLGCAACHRLRSEGQPIEPKQLAPPLQELDVTRGCLSDDRSPDVPDFQLTAQQRTALRKALSTPPDGSHDVEATITRTLITFNCYACHQRGDIGGVERARNEFFKTTMPEMGDEGRIPPALDGVGDKLQSGWVRHILADGADDRPYMVSRMPKFGQKNVGHLVDAFAQADRKDLVDPPEIDLPEHRIRAAGRFLVGDKALSCIKCHSFGKHEATGIQSIDLTIMTRRLREDWFYRYMLDPQSFRPGTRMPAAWPNGRSPFPDVLDGDPHKQLSAIWTYLSDGREAAVPRGLIRNPIELVPEDHPIVYRNFLEGVGTSGIAVGSPQKAHFAFDPESLSLDLIWHGAFIDASRHWTSRGAGFQSPLGDHVLSLNAGFPFAILESTGQPWPEDSAEERGYEFNGYQLDEQRRPIFLYGSDALKIEDFIHPIPGDRDAGLRRSLTVKFKEPPSGLWYRAAVGSNIEKLDDGWFLVDGALRVRPRQSQKAEPIIRDSEGQTELLLPVHLHDSRARIVQDYLW